MKNVEWRRRCRKCKGGGGDVVGRGGTGMGNRFDYFCFPGIWPSLGNSSCIKHEPCVGDEASHCFL